MSLWLPGLIPARAGKTGRRRTWGPGRRAHPRACGENSLAAQDSEPKWGSSPRVRGKPVLRTDMHLVGGLIPARAGKTKDEAGSALIRWGSSPRVRGKHQAPRRFRPSSRLIPARAGKTRACPRRRRGRRAHPRACGENPDGGRTCVLRHGSSPRVRGKLHQDPGGAQSGGLIPARAGKTPARRASSRRRRAHPRACGENIIVMAGLLSGLGSSPRVRGKRPPLVLFGAAVGLIPARAGKTVRGGGACTLAPAHPRACGENLVRRVPGDEEVGSSPRVRGKPCGPGG